MLSALSLMGRVVAYETMDLSLFERFSKKRSVLHTLLTCRLNKYELL